MAKKRKFMSLAMVLMLVGMIGGSAEAQPGVASVSKRGSLLVFPFINTLKYFGGDNIVQIGNDAPRPIMVKCYWMDSDQNSWDFEFPLTPNQSVWFSATTGHGSIDVSPFGEGLEGELKCWAVDTTTEPESVKQFNYLYGSVLIFDPLPGPLAFEYDAWAFALHGQPADPSGPLTLNGSTDYDACPAYLTYNFFARESFFLEEPIFFLGNWLALSPCQQDLRQDRSPICTKAKFDIWNENETKLTGAYQCIKCTSSQDLDSLGYDVFDTWGGCDLPKCKTKGFGGNKFSRSVLHTDMGRFRVTPSTFSACQGVFAKLDQDGKTVVDVCPPANQYQTPFVAVMISESTIRGSKFELHNVATAGVGAGAWTAPKPIPQILWDAGAGSAPSGKRN
jgi:hypothetical protein